MPGSSPLKNAHRAVLQDITNEANNRQLTPDGSPDWKRIRTEPPRILRNDRLHWDLASCSRAIQARMLDHSRVVNKRLHMYAARKTVQSYCSLPRDIYNSDSEGADLALPFAVVPCNTSPIVAVADEAGNVHLFDTSNDVQPDRGKAGLSA